MGNSQARRIIRSNKTKDLVAFSYQKLTVDGSVKNLTVPTGAKEAFCRFETDAAGIGARYLQTDQTTVSTTDGLALSNLDTFNILEGDNLAKFQITRAVAGTHVLHIEYYK